MSFAVIQTGGKQYKVKTGEILKIEKLEKVDANSKIEFKEILALSLLEKTFLEPFTSPAAGSLSSVDRSEFILDQPRINLIRRLLDIDDNLAATHARLSGELVSVVAFLAKLIA